MRLCVEEMEDGVFKVVYARQRRPSPSPGRTLFLQKIRSLWNVFLIEIFRGAPEVYGTCGGAASVKIVRILRLHSPSTK